MKKITFDGIDYSFRPASYTTTDDPLQAILANVQGAARRRMIRAYWAEGRLDELSEVLLKDVLSADERQTLGALHPALMGGEYLPEPEANAVEIARIELQSVTADVISIRGRLIGNEIKYSVHDEYGTEFNVSPASSSDSLMLKELIGMIDGAGFDQSLALDFTVMNFESFDDSEESLNEVRHFTTVQSAFYPQLALHYSLIVDQWIVEQLAHSDKGN